MMQMRINAGMALRPTSSLALIISKRSMSRRAAPRTIAPPRKQSAPIRQSTTKGGKRGEKAVDETGWSDLSKATGYDFSKEMAEETEALSKLDATLAENLKTLDIASLNSLGLDKVFTKPVNNVEGEVYNTEADLDRLDKKNKLDDAILDNKLSTDIWNSSLTPAQSKAKAKQQSRIKTDKPLGMSNTAKNFGAVMIDIAEGRADETDADDKMKAALGYMRKASHFLDRRLTAICARVFATNASPAMMRDQFEDVVKNNHEDMKDPLFWFVWNLVEEVDGNDELAKELFDRALEVAPHDHAIMLEWAEMLTKNGDFERGRCVFRAAIQAIPSRAPVYAAWYRMERLDKNAKAADALLHGGVEDLLKAGDLRGLHAWALQVHAVNPRDPASRSIFKKMAKCFGEKMAYPWQAWATMEMRCHNYEFARKLFEMALTNVPSDTSTYHLWGQSEFSAEQFESCKDVYRRAIDVASKNHHETLSTESFLALTDVERRLGNTSGVLAVLEQGCNTHPNNWELFKERVDMQWAENQTVGREMLQNFCDRENFIPSELKADDTTKALYQSLINDLKEKAYTLWGAKEYSAGSASKATELYEKALEFNPNNGAAIAGIGQVLVARGKMKEGIKVLQGGLKKDLKSSACFLQWGIALAKDRQVDAARKAFKYGLDREPLNADIFLQWGALEAEFGELEDAQDRLDRARHLSPNNIGVHEKLGQLNLRLKNVKGALENYTRCTELNPRNYKNWLARGLLLLSLDQHKTIRLMDEALTHIRPTENSRGIASLMVVKSRAEALTGSNTNSIHKAEEVMLEAAKVCPDFIPAHYWAAKLFYEPQGRWQEARDGYVKALRLIEYGKCPPAEAKFKPEIIVALMRIKRHALNTGGSL